MMDNEFRLLLIGDAGMYHVQGKAESRAATRTDCLSIMEADR